MNPQTFPPAPCATPDLRPLRGPLRERAAARAPHALLSQYARTPAAPGCASPGWQALVAQHAPAIKRGVRSAMALCRHPYDRELVADLIQEVYCRLLEGGGRRLSDFHGKDRDQAAAWLHRLAQNTTIDRLRAAAAAKRRVEGTAWDAACEVREPPAGPEYCPERRFLRREALSRFLARCQDFAGGERNARVLALVLVSGWTSREVALASGQAISVSAVDSMVHRFRRHLAAQGMALPVRTR